jgi:predicted nucleic acid-binding protein
MAYLIDSDVFIDISREMPEAIEYVDTLPSEWMISQITAMKLSVSGQGGACRPGRLIAATAIEESLALVTKWCFPQAEARATMP